MSRNNILVLPTPIPTPPISTPSPTSLPNFITILFFFFFFLLLTITSAQSTTTSSQQICNNSPLLCSRRYNNITYLGAHDSPYVRNVTNGYSVAGNQFYTTLQQLDSGVRLVSAQVHAVSATTGTGGSGTVQYRLCHSLCQLYDAGLLVDWLSGVKGWMDRNVNEVVTILLVNSDGASVDMLASIYRASGIDAISYTPPSSSNSNNSPRPNPTQWPTLSNMISTNRRVVNFVASLDQLSSSAPYLLNEFSYVFENPYEVIVSTDFSCLPDRPPSLRAQSLSSVVQSQNYLPLLNHFRYDNVSGILIPSVSNVNVTNSPSSSSGQGNFIDAANTCAAAYGGRAPTFVLLDFVNVGPALEVVDRLNGVYGQTTGRLVLPNNVADSMASPSPSLTSGGSVTTGTSAGTGTASTSGSGSAAATTATSRSDASRRWSVVASSERSWIFGISVIGATIGMIWYWMVLVI